MANAMTAMGETKTPRTGRVAVAAAWLTAALLTLAGIFEAYTKAVEALDKAVRASSVATEEPVAAAGYQELAKKVDELSAQQVAMHDDVVRLRGYLDGLARTPTGTSASAPAVVGLGPASRPAAAAPSVPVLREAPKVVRALPVDAIRRMSGPASLPQ